MVSVLNAVFKYFDDPEAMWILAYLAPNRRGHNQLEALVVPSSGVSVVMAAEDLPDSGLAEFGKHLFAEAALYIEVLFWLIRVLEVPRNVLEHESMGGLFGLCELLVQPLILLRG